MWVPKQIKIVNLMSHLETAYTFKQGKAILLQGRNLDDETQESNGSGKSALEEAVCYCLLGTGLRKALDVELIMEGKENCVLEFILHNTQLNKTLTIKREIFLKKSSTLELLLDDKKVQFATVKDGNKRLLELIGITREDLLNYYIISKEKYVSFYSSSDTDKKKVVSRFSNANIIDGVGDLVEKDLEPFLLEEKSLNDQEISIQAKIDVYNEQIETSETVDPDQRRQDIIDNYNLQIKNIERAIELSGEKILEKEEEIGELNEEMEIHEKAKIPLQVEIAKLKDKDYTKEFEELQAKSESFSKSISNLLEERRGLKVTLTEYEDLLDEMNKNIKGSVECPNCSYEFVVGDPDVNIETTKEILPSVEELIKEQNESLSKSKEKSLEIQAKKDELSSKKSLLEQEQGKKTKLKLEIAGHNNTQRELRQSIEFKENEIKALKQEPENYKKQIEVIKSKIKDVDKLEFEDKTLEYQAEIEKLEKQFPLIEKKREALKDRKFVVEQWSYNFKKFYSHLANKSVKAIEGLTNHFMERSKSNLRVRLEGYKMTSKGEIREKITPSILKNGIDKGNFFKLSGGQKGKIELSTICALQQLINMQSEFGGLDLLFIDEVLDSVDGLGMQYMSSSFEDVNKTIILITHVTIPSESACEVITVEYENGISKIV